MRIAIVGGSGFIGRSLLRRLGGTTHEAVAFSRTRPVDPELSAIAWVPLDVSGQIDPECLAGFDCVVNLVGIKRAAPGQSFEAVHVEAVQKLVDAASTAGVPQFIQVSVAGPDEARSDATRAPTPYRRSKLDGEAIVLASDREWTVLRPGVVYGPGDDMLGKLVPLVVQSPIFPAPQGGRATVQAVHVDDLCKTIVACIDHPERCRLRSFDVVPAERTSLEELVTRVSRALGLRTWVVAAPSLPQRAAAAVMERLMADPLITRSQLDLLGRGICGDGAALTEAMDIAPREASLEAFATVLREHPLEAADTWSLRLEGGPSARARRAEVASTVRGLASTIVFFLFVHTLAALYLSHPWWRVTALDGVVLTVGLVLGAWPLRKLFADRRPTLAWLGGGVLAAIMWIVGAGVYQVFSLHLPGLAGGVEEVLGWQALAPLWLTISLITLTVLCEELLWRGAIAIPLAHRLGPGRGLLIATLLYAAAHAFLQPPLLVLAALGAGFVWTWLAISRGNLVAAFVCHLIWDLLVFWLAPYG